MSIGLPQWIVLAIALLRLAELVYAQRNTKRLLANGGREFGRGHYPLFIVLHGGWLLALFFGVPRSAEVEPILLVFFGLLICGRVWVIATLGPYWTTRVISSPKFPLIRNGPYRFVRHPNYWVVTAEIGVLPLCFGVWQWAAVFSVLNAALLWWRIRIENEVLGQREGEGAAL